MSEDCHPSLSEMYVQVGPVGELPDYELTSTCDHLLYVLSNFHGAGMYPVHQSYSEGMPRPLKHSSMFTFCPNCGERLR